MLTWWIMATIKSITFAVPNEESVLKKKRVLSPAHQIKYNNSNNIKPEATKSNEKKRSKCPSNFPLSMWLCSCHLCRHYDHKNEHNRETIFYRDKGIFNIFLLNDERSMWLAEAWSLRWLWFGFITEGGHIVHWVFHLMLFYNEIDTFNQVKILMILSQTFGCTLELFFH